MGTMTTCDVACDGEASFDNPKRKGMIVHVGQGTAVRKARRADRLAFVARKYQEQTFDTICAALNTTRFSCCFPDRRGARQREKPKALRSSPLAFIAVAVERYPGLALRWPNTLMKTTILRLILDPGRGLVSVL
jgi:hypothetical protein